MHTICRTLWSVTLAWALLLITACQASSTGGGGGAAPICGNFICEGGEGGYCPQDCGAACPAACSAAVCTAAGEMQDCITDAKGCKVLAGPKACANGNACKEGACGTGASAPTCGDGQCAAGESAEGCPSDCAATGPTCGDGKCEPGESSDSCVDDCPADCQPSCDGIQCDDGCGATCEGQGCDDGKPCTTEAICKNGSCNAIKVKYCDDKNACTTDGCDTSGGCTHSPGAGGGCSDGDPCTTGDKCSGGKCIGLGKAVCDDADPCTVDLCKPGAGCNNTPAADGTACGGTGICVAGGCCTCPAGQYCNASGTCISANSCKGKCGQFDDKAACQCDPECTQYGDCCTDYAGVCSSCTPGAFANCCDAGKSLCYYDSCGKEEPGKKEPCAFGCEGAAPGQKFGACKSDPCGGFPSEGQCVTPGLVAYCANTTGDGATPSLEMIYCDKWEVCDDSLGFAYCAPAQGSCSPGQQLCAPEKANTMKFCSGDGTWQEYPCSGCAPTYLQGLVACPGDMSLVPTTFAVTYDGVGPKAGYTGYDKGNPQTRKPIYALAFLVRSPSGQSAPTVLDAAVVDGNGSVTLDFPELPTADDYVMLGSVGYDPNTGTANFAVLEPDVLDGKVEVSSDNPLDGKPYWWAKSAASIAKSGKWHITQWEKSWALQVFDSIRYDWYNAKSGLWGEAGKQVAIWLREGTDFSCGACFAPWPTASGAIFGKVAASQMWISSSDETYWSAAVMHHEVGHWAMSSFGTSPNEGGTHYLNTKVPPGMAWSEGWATFFSSMARGSGVYYDQGGNGMFWMDLGKVKYESGTPLLPFTASGGLTQFMDENRVAAALWNSAVKSQEPFKDPGNQGFWKALISNQMNNPPFTRPYNRQTWDTVTPKAGTDLNATYTGLKQTNTPATTLPAYLDALLCAAPQLKSAVAAAIAPLPFPVNTPICKP